MEAGLLWAPNSLVLENLSDPERGPGDLMNEVRAATVCGTGIRLSRGGKTAGVRYPSVTGREFAGEIAEAPEGGPCRAGQRVCVEPAIPRGHCAACKLGHEYICEKLTAVGYEVDGASAERFRIPARAVEAGDVHAVPDDLPFEQAALAESFAWVIDRQQRVGISAGEAIVVLGAGPIGLLNVELVRLSRARSVIVSEASPGRRGPQSGRRGRDTWGRCRCRHRGDRPAAPGGCDARTRAPTRARQPARRLLGRRQRVDRLQRHPRPRNPSDGIDRLVPLALRAHARPDRVPLRRCRTLRDAPLRPRRPRRGAGRRRGRFGHRGRDPESR